MTEIIMRNAQDTSRLMGFLRGTDFTKPKKIVIKDLDRSGEQNKLLHARLTDIASQVEHAGKKWD
ncbi:MAG: NinB family protein, partial [Oxalobacteraceae bacterium]